MLYVDSSSRFRANGKESESIPINAGVHQGSALNPLLFILIMEEETKECTGEELRQMLYADDLVISARSMEEVEQKLLERKLALEPRGMKVNLGKTNLMVTGLGVVPSSILCISCRRWCYK